MPFLGALVCLDRCVDLALLLGSLADLEEVLGQDDSSVAGAVLFFLGELHHLFPVTEVSAGGDLHCVETKGDWLSLKDRTPSDLVTVQEYIGRGRLGGDLEQRVGR